MTEPTEDSTGALKDLTGSLRSGWQRFLAVYEPLRPELFRYCRYLTRSPWDAEDLAQDTMARAADVCRELEVPFRTNGYRNW